MVREADFKRWKSFDGFGEGVKRQKESESQALRIDSSAVSITMTLCQALYLPAEAVEPEAFSEPCVVKQCLELVSPASILYLPGRGTCKARHFISARQCSAVLL